MKNLLFSAILGLVLIIGHLNLQAQNIGFDYDAAGNRTARYVIELKSATAREKTNDQKEFTDLLNGVAVKIYPNPTGGKLTVKLSGQEPGTTVKLQVCDLSGRQLYNNENADSQSIIDISKQKNGLYLLNVIVNDKKRVWKIIKR